MAFNLKSGFTWLGAQFTKQVMGDADTKMRAMGEAIVGKARSLAPERTGALKAGIGYTYRQSDHTLSIHADEPYSIFQEYGTRYIRPHPFIRPAIAAVAGRVWGASAIEIEFANTPFIKSPILAHPGGKSQVIFKTPKTLTSKQLSHVRRHLVPTSARLYKSKAVRNARLIVGRKRP